MVENVAGRVGGVYISGAGNNGQPKAVVVAISVGINAFVAQFPGHQFYAFVHHCLGRVGVVVGANESQSHRVGVLAVMRADNIVLSVLTSGAAFVNFAGGINQIVVANIAPTQGVGVEIPDSAHNGGPIANAVPTQVVGGGGMGDDDVREFCLLRRPAGAVLAVGRPPLRAGDDGRPGRGANVGGAFEGELGGNSGVGGALAGVAKGQIEGMQNWRLSIGGAQA